MMKEISSFVDWRQSHYECIVFIVEDFGRAGSFICRISLSGAV